MTDTWSPEEEQDLITRASTDADALRRLYRHYHPRVFGYVAHRVGRRQDAEDIVSEVFIRVVKALHRFEYRGAGSFTAYLFQIARNEVARFFKQHLRDGMHITLDDLPHIESEMLPPDQQMLRKERYQQLRQHIETLSARRREIVQLRFFAGLRNQEIAAVLELDERTVASHLSRALEDLRHDYQPLVTEED